MQIWFTDRTIDAVSYYMPQLVRRVEQFCAQYDMDMTAEEAREFVWRSYGSRDHRMGLWFIVNDAHAIVGHLLAQPEPFDTPKPDYILVRQAQIDKGVDTHKENVAIFDAVKNWARWFGTDEIRMVTHRSTKVFSRAWGFQPFKTIMKMKIDAV